MPKKVAEHVYDQAGYPSRVDCMSFCEWLDKL